VAVAQNDSLEGDGDVNRRSLSVADPREILKHLLSRSRVDGGLHDLVAFTPGVFVAFGLLAAREVALDVVDDQLLRDAGAEQPLR